MVNVLVAGMSDPARLGRGRTYARQGAVLDLDVQPGVVTALVQGSRPQPYEVSINTTAAVDTATMSALVPTRRDVTMLCSCPDWDDPCKHAVAVMVALAQRIGDDPTLLTRWRGAEVERSSSRAVVGSRGSSGSPTAGAVQKPSAYDADGRAALDRMLQSPGPVDDADTTVSGPEVVVSTLAAPVPAWGELWSEMLADALGQLRTIMPGRRS
jgi:uncharacterized Zn finger protein